MEGASPQKQALMQRITCHAASSRAMPWSIHAAHCRRCCNHATLLSMGTARILHALPPAPLFVPTQGRSEQAALAALLIVARVEGEAQGRATRVLHFEQHARRRM